MGVGRRPKPTAIKILEGNPGKRKIVADDLQPEVGIPEKPKYMPFAAQREWDFITPILLELGVLTLVDSKSIAAYCVCYARWEEADRKITEFGPLFQVTYQDNEGNTIVGDLKENPACKIADRCLARMKSYLTEFGLTPASRAKLKIGPKPVKDKFDSLMERPAAGFFTPEDEFELPSVEIVNKTE